MEIASVNLTTRTEVLDHSASRLSRAPLRAIFRTWAIRAGAAREMNKRHDSTPRGSLLLYVFRGSARIFTVVIWCALGIVMIV